MPSIPKITDADIRQWVGSDGLSNGRAYYRNGSLDRLRRQGLTLKGRCAGYSAPYYLLEATLHADGSVASAACTCPVGDGGHCKHVGALLAAFRAEPESFPEVREVTSTLAERSKEELIALIQLLLEHAPELSHLTELRLPGVGGAGVRVDPEPYRRQVTAVFDEIDPHDWQAIERAEPELKSIIQFAHAFLAQHDSVNAARVGQAIVGEIIAGYEAIEDEGSTFLDLVAEGCRLLVACLSGLEPEERKQLLHFLLDTYWFIAGAATDEDVEMLRSALAQQTTPEERAALAEALRTRLSEEDADEWVTEAAEDLLCDLEADTVDPETYLAQLRERGRSLDLIRELLKRDRLAEAVEEAAAQPDERQASVTALFEAAGQVDALESHLRKRERASKHPAFLYWLVNRYADADPARALAIAERLFQQPTSPLPYETIRELALRCGRWDELYPQLIEHLESRKQWRPLSEAYLLEGEIDRALDLLNVADPAYLDAIAIARAAEETRPLQAIEIYQKHAQAYIDARGRGSYAAAASLLVRVRDLYRQTGEGPAWDRYIQSLRERHKNLPALKDELSAAGL